MTIIETALKSARKPLESLFTQKLTTEQVNEFHLNNVHPIGSPDIGRHLVERGENEDLGNYMVIQNTNKEYILISEHPYVGFIEDGEAPTRDPDFIDEDEDRNAA